MASNKAPAIFAAEKHMDMKLSAYPYPEDRVSAMTSLAPLCFRIILMYALAPVFCPGCSDPEPAFADSGPEARTVTRLSLSAFSAGPSGIRCLDLFFFNDDKLQRLDAYQRLEGSALTAAVGASRGGGKILAVLANSPAGRFRWADAGSLDALRGLHVRLQDEDPAHPQMSALVPVLAGGPAPVPVTLSPYTARVELESICCDFSGRPYAGASLENVRVYLTQVSASVPAVCDSVPVPVEILHAGRFKPGDMAGFLHPEILCDNLSAPVGRTRIRPGTVLFCFPNTAVADSPGAPPTRLVIEGTLEGRTCYYPLEIGRGAFAGDPPGVLPGRTYRFGLTLTRRGADDPDGALEPGTVITDLHVIPWVERNDIIIPF